MMRTAVVGAGLLLKILVKIWQIGSDWRNKKGSGKAETIEEMR